MTVHVAKQQAWSYVLVDPIKILVVDDDPILCEFAKVYLATPVATVETAADVESALTLLREQAFDIVLIDIEMPKRDGFSLLEAIRNDPTMMHLPTMMLTGREDIGSIDRSYNLGATAFATKPVNWRQLSYHIRYIVRSAAVERDLRQQLETITAPEQRPLQ